MNDMLNYFRQHPLRKSLWLIVLLGSLLTQTQTLFACELMGGGPATTCCCDEDMSNGCPMSKNGAGGCEMPDNGIPTGCCDVSTDISVGLPDVAVADSHHFKQVLALDAPQPPPALIFATDLSVQVSVHSVKITVNDFSSSVSSPGTHTYLVTNRFRI